MIHARSLRAAAVALLLVSVAAAASAEVRTLKTVEFASPAVGRTMKYNILLPKDYETSTTRYPVLYLMHGLSQNYTAWGLQNGTPFYAGLYDDLIVVMPDGGNSWYVNWATNEAEAEEQLGRSHRQGRHRPRGLELPDDCPPRGSGDRRVVDGRIRRADAGASASRALHLDRQHERRPGAWTSGGRTVARRRASAGCATAAPADRGGTGGGRGGQEAAKPCHRHPRLQQPGRADAQGSGVREGRRRRRVRSVQADPAGAEGEVPHIYIDCGTEDRLIAGARELAGILLEKNIPFDYMQMPGAHNSAYWIQSVGHIMAAQYEVMQRALGQRPFGRTAATPPATSGTR